jgi:hypothetical protein
VNADWCSRFVAGTTDLTLDIPFRPHTPDSIPVGGARTSATGVTASYIVREDEVVTVTFRVWEEEYVAFRNVLRWGQRAETITWYPDALEPESYVVWLDAPRVGERFGVVRDTEFGPVYEITCEFRSATGVPFDIRYFREAGI